MQLLECWPQLLLLLNHHTIIQSGGVFQGAEQNKEDISLQELCETYVTET